MIYLVASVGDCVAVVFYLNKSMYGITRMCRYANVNINTFHVNLFFIVPVHAFHYTLKH